MLSAPAALLLALVAGLAGTRGARDTEAAPLAQQAPNPTIEVLPAGVAPGETVTLRGSGWLPETTLTARMYRKGDAASPGAFLSGAFAVGAGGTFSVAGAVPHTLFGPGDRGNVEVVPGDYTIVIRQDAQASASTTHTVGARRERCFRATGYCVERDAFWDYFAARGRAETFAFR